MMYNDMQEWLKAAKAGEDAAWNVLYKQYYPSAYATALRICGHTPAAKDAVQDAFITAYLKLSQLKDAAAFGGWIKKIVIRNCYRSIHQRFNENIDQLPVETDSWWEDQVNMKFDHLSTQSRLYTALTQLPEALRSALLLRYFSSYQSYEEIATILSVPVGTIRSRLNQAKIKLTEYWQEHSDAGENVFRETQEWNSFYYAAYCRMHAHDGDKNKFIDHLDKNIRIILSKDNSHRGRNLFENMVADDRRAGSSLAPTNVLTCGNISVIEVQHFNSPEYPDHCPPASVSVLYRDKAKASQMNLYIARQ